MTKGITGWFAVATVCLSAAVPWGVTHTGADGSLPAMAGSHSALPTWQVLAAARTLPTFYEPAGLAVDSSGNVYVADAGNFRMLEIGPHGQLLAHFGEASLRPGPEATVPPSGAIPTGPASLAVDARGTVYVADTNHHAIRVFSPQHRLVASWPSSVAGARVLLLAVAAGGRGTIIVAIAAQVRCSVPAGPTYCTTYAIVQRRSPSGALLGQFHSPIGPSGMAAMPPIINQIAVTVDSRGSIYVATGGTLACYRDCLSFHFLAKYASGGKELARWGTQELDISANWPAAAVDGAGNVFLADDYNHRIEKRTARGTVVGRWPLGSIFPTPPRCSGTPQAAGCVQPSGVAVDRHGDVYASDPGSNRILKLSPQGRLLAQWGTGGSESGRFWSPTSLALDAGGRLWVDDATTGRIQVLGADGRFHVQFAVANVGPALALDHQGNVYLGQRVGQSVVISKFSSSGTRLERWGGLHLAELPSGIAVAPNGDIVVVSFFIFHDPSQISLDGLDILRLSPSGRRLGLIHVTWTSTGSGIAVDAQENSYIAYGTTPRFEKYSRDGVLLASWGAPKAVAEISSSPSPAGLTLDAAGNIYVSNTPENVIDEYRPGGTLLHTWGMAGSYPGQFHQPGGIAVDAKGSIYVADTGNHRIEKLASRSNAPFGRWE